MKKLMIFLTALVIILTSCSKEPDKKAQLEKLKKERDGLTAKINKLEEELSKLDTSGKNSVAIAITEVKTEVFKHYIEVQGKVDGEDNIAVSPKTMGTITAIYVKQGQLVRAGQVLAQIDDEILQKSMIEIRSQLEFATNLYIKQKNLYDQKIGSEVQYLTAKNNKESLENRVKTMQDQLDMCKIKSPINGTVEDIPIKIGQSVAPGFPVFRVINFSIVKAVAEVAETFAMKVNINDDCVIYFPDIDKEIEAKVTFSSKFINPVNRTFTVESRFNPQGANLRANMIAVMRINDYKAENAVVIPVNVIQSSMNSKYVFVVKEEKGKKVARRQDITIGMTYNGAAEIIKGLAPGEKIITTGYQYVKDGQEVKF